MSDAFNPYYEWLGIPPKQQPAEVSYSPTAIDAARKKLDDYQPDKKKKK